MVFGAHLSAIGEAMDKKQAWELLEKMQPLTEAIHLLEKNTYERYFHTEHEADGRTVAVFAVVGKARVEHIKRILDDPFAGSGMVACTVDENGVVTIPPQEKP